MKYLQILILSVFIIGCTNDSETPIKKESESETEVQTKTETEKELSASIEKEDLVVIKGKSYVEYYPGKKQIKFEGRQDAEQRRHGKWSFYSPEGKELSTTVYDHGLKHGHMIVKHPNGALYYHGEMYKDKKVGVWKNYDDQGTLLNETDFGPKE